MEIINHSLNKLAFLDIFCLESSGKLSAPFTLSSFKEHLTMSLQMNENILSLLVVYVATFFSVKRKHVYRRTI